jgi:3-hydroxyacyl-[acyl-carrier-protein] dehydratase
MSILVQEIQQSMLGLTDTADGHLTARFIFPREFVGFQGHFHDRPVLAGVCMILAAVSMLQAWQQKEVRIKEIVQAKFFAPVSCDEELVFECWQQTLNAEESVVKTSVTHNGRKTAELKLRVGFVNEKPDDAYGAK